MATEGDISRTKSLNRYIEEWYKYITPENAEFHFNRMLVKLLNLITLQVKLSVNFEATHFGVMVGSSDLEIKHKNRPNPP